MLTLEDAPQTSIGSEARSGACSGCGQGSGRSRSFVRAWKTVTKLLGTVTAS